MPFTFYSLHDLGITTKTQKSNQYYHIYSNDIALQGIGYLVVYDHRSSIQSNGVVLKAMHIGIRIKQ